LYEEIRHRLTEKIAENMKREFEKIGSDISEASGANFKYEESQIVVGRLPLEVFR
jgi:hypothetical protein